MKIVIDIPESDYNRIMASNAVEYYELKIAQGIVLPKGHGDLIDRDVAYAEFDKAGCSWEGKLLNFVHVVIPADK